MKDEIGRLVLTGQLPNPFFSPNMIVDMVTAPGIKSGAGGAAGYNNFGLIQSGFPSGFAGYIWNGTTFGKLGLADACGLIFSHEMAECMTDPGGNGFEVNPGANWPNPAANSNQIGDYEGNSYSYRSHGGLVQPYWSARDQQWLVTDGNSQTVNVKPKWTTNPNGTRTITYNVTVNGGQRGGADALTIGSFAAQGNQPPGEFPHPQQ